MRDAPDISLKNKMNHRFLYLILTLLGCTTLAAQSPEQQAVQALKADSAAQSRFITRATLYGVGGHQRIRYLPVATGVSGH